MTEAGFPWRLLQGAERRREIDAYDPITGIAHEAKIGEVRLVWGGDIHKEIVKDEWLLQNPIFPRVGRAIWHFFCSANTGKMGPDPETRVVLIGAGISIVLHIT